MRYSLRFAASLTLAALMVVLTLVSVACSGKTSPGIYERILSLVPDTEGNRSWVAINDYSRARAQLQQAPLSINATVDEQIAYFISFFSLAADQPDGQRIMPAVFGLINRNLSYMYFELESLSNFHIGYWSVDQEANFGPPPDVISMIKGTFDTEAIRNSAAWSGPDNPPDIETYPENEIYGWGGDNQLDLTEKFAFPGYDFIGRGGRFVFQSDHAFKTNNSPAMRLLLDTQNGEHASLADINNYLLIARELDAHAALFAIFTDQTQSAVSVRQRLVSNQTVPAQDIDGFLAEGPLLQPYQAMGLGLAKDENGFYLLIVLVHETGEAAASNATRFLQRLETTSSALTGESWAATLHLVDTSVTSRGTIMTAKLYGENITSQWAKWYYIGEPLVLHP